MITCWGSASERILAPVQTLQNRALRNVFWLPPRTNRISMYLHLVESFLPVRGIFFVSTASFVYNCMKHNTHTNIEFTKSSDISRRSLRMSNPLLRPTTHTTNYGKKAITAIGAKIFNSVPSDITRIPHQHGFKWALRCYIRKSHFMKSFIENFLKSF